MSALLVEVLAFESTFHLQALFLAFKSRNAYN
jgi:hypothetical protein